MDAAPTTVLVVDNNADLRALYEDILHEFNPQVTVLAAGSAEATLRLLKTESPDLIVLDLMLPDKDGLVLIARIRQFSMVPIIVCTGQTDQASRVLGLKFGADDFIAKPFDLVDLVARIDVVLRRSRRVPIATIPDKIEVGDLTILQKKRAVFISGRRLQVTPTEYQLLFVLATNDEPVVSRLALSKVLWGLEDASTRHSLDVFINRIRQKMRRTGAPGAEIIQTVWGKGFVLAPRGTVPIS